MLGNYKRKDNSILAREWDQIARDRAIQLNNHKDLSMDLVLIPFIKRMLSGTDTSNVIDIGCGTGYASNIISKYVDKLTGIDISQKSIHEAKKISNEVSFLPSSIEDFAANKNSCFTLAIANMTFQDVVNLDEVIGSTSKILKKGSYLIATITHPFFWPFYWDYHKEKWFDYTKEIEIEAKFDISLNKSKSYTTHYHRPLEKYIDTLISNGFEIINLIEPVPSDKMMTLYPQKWEFPRFLGIKCRKNYG